MSRSVSLDISRHVLDFNPDVFGERRVDIIGCGAVGARVAMELAAFGIRCLHIWDGDTIESHNIANQRPYLPSDMGKKKAEALAAHMVAVSGIEPTVHAEYLTKPEHLGEVVFLCVDKMSTRRKIFDDCLHLKPHVLYVIEVRMGVDELRVYGFNPSVRSNVAQWTKTLYDDAVAVESVCQARRTVGDAASITAGLAVARFRHWYKKEIEKDPTRTDLLRVEQVLMLRPLTALSH